MSKILSFLGSILGVKALEIGILIFYYTALFSFYYFMFDSAIQFYNLVSDFLTMLTYTGSDDYLSKFFGLLNCIGFVDAFNSAKPVLIASLTFIFLKLGWSISVKFKENVVDKALKVF